MLISGSTDVYKMDYMAASGNPLLEIKLRS